ncbi:hypothetical protein DPEC_G00282220 [Dallia pectoralis]|uniref:Uncharacterized protein n=1 Tax=Dallia pectoralis TaxID=75939 RepID=A0ACC2FNC8_DALPE|nr:hypothetical protein DPEC_G00282220 [Dallia pectoralis]
MYGKEPTVEVEVEGTENGSMMKVLRAVKKECEEVLGCRVRGERKYELTMKNGKAKEKLMDGTRVKGALCGCKGHYARECVGTEREEEERDEKGGYVDEKEEWEEMCEDITEDEVEGNEMEQAEGGVERGEDGGGGMEMELAGAEVNKRGREGSRGKENKRGSRTTGGRR